LAPQRFRRARPSIYEHVRAHINPSGPGLLVGGEELPDDADFQSGGVAIPWAPGAREGTLYRYADAGDEADSFEQVAAIHAALVALADRPAARRRSRLRRLFREAEPRAILDDLLERLAAYPPRDVDRAHDEMRSLLLRSGNRNEVKFAIALTSIFGRPDDAELFRTIARHEEFTLYGAVALARLSGDPTQEWLALLDVVSEWGKTEVSELLLRDPSTEVCDALLRRGRSVGNALALATGCRLHETLSAPEIDAELLDGARGIVHDLVAGFEGPEELADYPEGAIAVERLLVHLEPRANTLDEFLTVYAISEYLRQPTEADEERLREFLRESVPDESELHAERLAQAGFNRDRLIRVEGLCESILERPDWRRLAEEGLESPDDSVRDNAFEAARQLGLPLHEYLLKELERRPADAGVWFNFVAGGDAGRIDEALRLVDRLLPLEEIATGPSDELGLGPAFEQHMVVDFLLQELERFPGKGWNVIGPALQSPVIGNRMRALRALSNWPVAERSGEVLKGLQACEADPDREVRRAVGAVIRGQSFPEPELKLGEGA
jgi:hypothetical protein